MDKYAPFQIYTDGKEAWLCNEHTNEQYFRGLKTEALMKMLKKLQARYNTQHTFSSMGI